MESRKWTELSSQENVLTAVFFILSHVKLPLHCQVRAAHRHPGFSWNQQWVSIHIRDHPHQYLSFFPVMYLKYLSIRRQNLLPYWMFSERSSKNRIRDSDKTKSCRIWWWLQVGGALLTSLLWHHNATKVLIAGFKAQFLRLCAFLHGWGSVTFKVLK